MTGRGAVLRLADTPDALAAAAAAETLALLETAIAWRGQAHLGLAGGRTPAALYRHLAASAFTGWPHVHVWFGDERTVPPDHAESNYGMARETLLDATSILAAHVHRLHGEREPLEAARHYDEALEALARRQGREAPALDVVLLGLGTDAHTASIFPGSPLLGGPDRGPDNPARWAAAVHVPALQTWRLTLTPETLRHARAVLLLVAGADKHAALRRVLAGHEPPEQAPARLVLDLPGDTAWFVDAAALFGHV